MKKKYRKYPLIAAAMGMMLLASCSETMEMTYIKDAPRDVEIAQTGEFSKGIQSNDLLYIYVESRAPEATVRFNQETNKIAVDNGVVMNPGSSAVTGYLVNNEGDIIFPVLGKIHVEGMTHAQLASTLEQRLVGEGHILDAVVTVKLMNFKVSVLGEVTRPGVIEATGERLTIFEALSMVGDLTLYGLRDNVTVIREENGVRTVGEIDLTTKDVFDSPYYYLHQNDVVYVEPNVKRKKAAVRDPMTLSYISSAVSIVSLLTSAFYYYILAQRYVK
jgi:polysaccharide export outer membrane protein